MASKQNCGVYAPDGAKYATTTDGAGTLVSNTTSLTGLPKQAQGSQAPDGSIYMCLTDGGCNLV